MSNPIITQQDIRSALQLVQITAEAIRVAGNDGIPAGHLYAAMNAKGCQLNTYEKIEKTLVNAGLVTKTNNLLVWAGE